MRIHELVIRVPGGDARFAFHPRLTVLSGLARFERQALADGIAASLLGGDQDSLVTYVDGGGRWARAMCSGGRLYAEYEDGSAAPSPLSVVGPRTGSIRDILVPPAPPPPMVADRPEADRSPEHQPGRAELAGAVSLLADLEHQLEAARRRRAEAEDLRDDIAAAEKALATVRRDAARREYSRALAELELVELEWRSVQGEGDSGEEADLVLLAAVDRGLELADRALAARERISAIHASTGGGRMPGDDDPAAATIPFEQPVGLAAIVTAHTNAQQRRRRLEGRLRELVRSAPGEPSDPAVHHLATLDGDELQEALELERVARHSVQQAQVDLGGSEVGDTRVATPVERVEAAHDAATLASQDVERLRVPAVAACSLALVAAGPAALWHPAPALTLLLVATGSALAGLALPVHRHRLAARAEHEALEDVRAASYLGFHLRRIEATVDPGLPARARQAVHDHCAATAQWVLLTGGSITPERARELLPEVLAHREAQREHAGTMKEIRQLRGELVGVVQPAARVAWEELAGLCESYRIDPAELEAAADPAALFSDRILLGRRVRALRHLRTAEAEESSTVTQLNELLRGLGIEPAGIEPAGIECSVDALERVARPARRRCDIRRRGRSPHVVAADLRQLKNRVAELRRPEWSTVEPSDEPEPDVASVGEAVQRLRNQLRQLERAGDDVEHLASRREALLRRVASLQPGDVAEPSAAPATTVDVHRRIAAHLAAAATGSPGDAIPVVLDEPLQMVDAQRRWDLLDFVLRVSERHQIVYLTGDPFVTTWARQRLDTGHLRLMEPEPDLEVELDRSATYSTIGRNPSR